MGAEPEGALTPDYLAEELPDGLRLDAAVQDTPGVRRCVVASGNDRMAMFRVAGSMWEVRRRNVEDHTAIRRDGRRPRDD